jgi:GntR family transcriptional regulator/MocR family aminotransferase
MADHSGRKTTRAGAAPLITIDPSSRAPLQQQIYQGLRRAILSGSLTPGTRLLSSRALATELAVSRTTTLLAFDQLLAEGYVSARHGSGTFVAIELPDDLPRVARVRSPSRGTLPGLARRGLALASMPPAARRLGASPRAFRLGVPALDLVPTRLWSQLLARRTRSATLAQLDYGDPAGLKALREAIAAHVSTTRGTHCTADQVFVVAGAQRGLEWICRLLLDPGDAVWLEEPGYPGARSALVGAGARILPARVDASGLDVEAAARHAGHARLAYVTPSHQFPLGVPMTLPRRLALLKWASDARAWILEDDYDSEFRYATRAIPCLHGLAADGRVIYVGSFSKTFFPSLRLGFLIVPEVVHEALVAVRRGADLHPPTLDQAALADFMIEGHYERHLRRMRAVYAERLEALAAAADRYGRGAITLRPVRTGLHAVADLHAGSPEAVCEEAMSRGLEVMPLSAYFVGEPHDAHALVLGFGAVRPEAMAVAVQRLVAAIDAVRSRRLRPDARAAGARRR